MWRLTNIITTNASGPISLLRKALQQVRWKWRSPTTIEMSCGLIVDILVIEKSEWEGTHGGDALRVAQWRVAAFRRDDMQGVQYGVCKDSITALLHGKGLDVKQKGLLRCILAGAIWTEDRRHRARMMTTGTCPYCRTR